jgi:hypothetical protein
MITDMTDDMGDELSDVGNALRACARCHWPMRLSYRETVETAAELRVYECPHCRTTMTLVTGDDDHSVAEAGGLQPASPEIAR